MKIIQTILLLVCVILLISIFNVLSDMRDDRTLRVTEVNHNYNYNVESYGTIRLNDKLVNFREKR